MLDSQVSEILDNGQTPSSLHSPRSKTISVVWCSKSVFCLLWWEKEPDWEWMNQTQIHIVKQVCTSHMSTVEMVFAEVTEVCRRRLAKMTLKCHGNPISDRFAMRSRNIAFSFLVVYRGQERQTRESLSFTWLGSQVTFKEWGRLLSRSVQGQNRIMENATCSAWW